MRKSFFGVVIVFFVFSLCYVSAQRNTEEQLAAQYLRNKEYDKAVILYAELFEKNPSSPIIYNNLLDCYIQLNDFKEAQKVINSQIKSNPDQIRFMVDNGWITELSANQRRARRIFEGLISDVQSNPRHIISLADAFEFRGYLDYALDTYMKGRRVFGNSEPFNRYIAKIYEKKKEYVLMMEEYVDMLNLGPQYMEQSQGILQDAINDDSDYSKNNALRQVLISRTQRESSNFIYSEMLLWLSIQQKDFNLAFNQARSLDRRLMRGGELVNNVAKLSSSNKEFSVAIEAFTYVVNLGKEYPYYLDAYIGLLDAKFLKVVSDYGFKKEDLYPVEKEYEVALKDLTLHAQSVRLLRNLANMKAFYLGKSDEAISLLEMAIDLNTLPNRVRAECRIELADILVLTGDVWEANLLYAQVDRTFKDDPIAHEARFKNARLSYFIGEFDWAKAQLDVLKAATSKLIANDAMKLSLRIQDNIGFDKNVEPLMMFAKSERMIFMNRFQNAIETLDSIIDIYPTHEIVDDVLFAKADINLKNGRYVEADSLLAFIVEHFPQGLLADEALNKRAEIQEKALNNPQKAMSLYQQLLTTYPGSINTVIARNNFRRLRESIVN
jgi:tetratricopeptide (TPR) repeat protein